MAEESVKLLLQFVDSFSNFLDSFFFPVFNAWWWILLPLFLFKPFTSSWLWWKQSLNIKDRKYVLLEIKMPIEILKPIKAMEHVFEALFGAVVMDHEPGLWREKWIDGETTLMPSLSFEIVGLNGETHFFVRTEQIYRHAVESALHSQYPGIEMIEVPDYVESVPQDIPNDKWRLENREFVLKKPDCYPIKTYQKFETEAERKEEKRVDPMARLLEGLSVLKEGEQIWLQIIPGAPAGSKQNWEKEGEEIRDKLVKRPGPKPPPKPMLLEAAEIMFTGAKEREAQKEERLLPPEMLLTPGEKEAVKEVERKMSKSGFGTTIRIIYLGKKEVFFKPHIGLPISFLLTFNTGNLNRFGTFNPTSTKVKSVWLWFLDKRRAFLRQRRAFRNYKTRVNPMFPKNGGISILNSEELATIFHFPSRAMASAPLVPRIESRKGEAPPGLPID